MSDFSSADHKFMQRALELAANGRFGAHPNPMVGCVLVQGERIVGEGWHALAGEAHAEVVALLDAGEAARDATAYVTLEPCSHHGKTPPCCDALIAAGVGEVIVARADPNPRVDGQGIAKLRKAGIGVRSGLLADDADRLMAGFLCRIKNGRPRVRLKIAASLDGRTAMASGESQWITGEEARADVQRLRAESGAVLTGIGTVLADDPSLTVRDQNLNPHDRQPLRVILDRQLRTPIKAKLLSLPGTTLIFCSTDSDAQPLQNAGAEIIEQDFTSNSLDLAPVLSVLAERQVNDVLVEAGPTLAGQFLEQQLVDQLLLYQAPQILGSETRGMVETPGWQRLADRLHLNILDVTRFGRDTRITAIPDYN
jgi:diaminohydroxyphosphoribosylaminopyrimidine deaminase/5-amino-6-(5-phosphoribosylamino)uracil reductase